MMPRDSLVTNSRVATYAACPRLHDLHYNQGYRLRRRSHALRFGTLWHLVMERLWSGLTPYSFRELSEADPYDRETVLALLAGYRDFYGDPPFHGRVEQVFRCELPHPQSDGPPIMIGGKIDVLLSDQVIDHKTTSSDIVDPSYRDHLAASSQALQYFLGAESLGVKAERFTFDVVSKPGIRPLKATPPESIRYRKDGEPYASTRFHDETPEEYGKRLRELVAEAPEKFFRRVTFTRDDAALEEFHEDLYTWGTRLLNDEEHPKNHAACHNYGRCPMWDVCHHGMRPEEHPDLFEKLDDVHPELQ